jgi:Zn-dependent protease with chaperone function
MLRGHYVDGVRPVVQDVEVVAGPEGLAIRLSHAPAPVPWSYADILVEQDGLETRLIHVRREIDTGERLALNTLQFEQAFGAMRGRFRTRRPGEAGGWRIAGWSLLAAVSLALIVFVGLPAFARFGAPLVPYSWEVKLGRNVEQDVLQMVARGKPVSNCTEPGTPARAALDQMIAKLTVSLELKAPLRVDIINIPVINAFALPGGRIFLFRPVIEKAATPDEVAGVLAHEIGHVVKRDSMRAVLHDGALSVLAGMLLGDVTGGTAIALLGRTALGSAFSRDQEREADEISVRLMREAGADPRAINIFFRKLVAQEQKGGDGGLLSTFRSHPLTAERIEAVDRLAEANEPARPQPILPREAWQALKSACAGL